MDIAKAFEVAFNRKIEKNWEKIYVVVDIHDTILRACYENEETYNYYPYSREALQLMTNREDICLILWSGCYNEKNIPSHLREYISNSKSIPTILREYISNLKSIPSFLREYISNQKSIPSHLREYIPITKYIPSNLREYISLYFQYIFKIIAHPNACNMIRAVWGLFAVPWQSCASL